MLNGYPYQPHDDPAAFLGFSFLSDLPAPLQLENHAAHAPSTSFSYLPSSSAVVTPSSVRFSTPSEFHTFNTPPVLSAPPEPAPDDSQQDAKRPAGACARCRRMKLRCELVPAYQTCRRCNAGQHECVFEGRKPRTPSERQWLIAQIRQKDATIATLLEAHRPTQSTPLTLAATKLVLPPAQRAAHHDVLARAEKGVVAASLRWNILHRERAPKDNAAKDNTPDDDDSDEWSSDESSEGEDPWDADAAAAAGPAGIGAVYAHALPEAHAPLGLIARMSLEEAEDARTKRTADAMEVENAEEDADWGIANPGYFQPGPSANLALRRVLNGREMPPVILASGLITWADAEKLFEVFYEFVNPYVSLLDRFLHSCSSVFERCPFLFTVICAVSLRYHSPRPGLHKVAMHFAKTAAAKAFIDGIKSVELVQGYFLLGVYGLPARRWEEDRRWFYGGLATRIAVDLGLHKPTGLTTKPLSERHARELRNRVRTWLICFNIDRSSSTQFGKPSGIHDEALVSQAREWYRGRYSHPYDVHLVVYSELMRVMSRFHEQVYVNGILNRNCDFRAVTEATEAELRAWHDDTTWRYENESDPNDRACVFRTKGVPFFVNYMRLVMYSFGFQDAWRRRGVERGDMFFAKCLQAASAVVRHVIVVDAPGGYLKYAPDGHFVAGGFCGAFLIKLLRPEFASLIDQEQRARIISLVTQFVDVLGSPDAAIDEAHTPKLYSRFLRGQLRAVSGDTALESHSSESSASSASTPVPSTPVRSPGLENASEGSGWPRSWAYAGSEPTTTGGGSGAGTGSSVEYLAMMEGAVKGAWLNKSTVASGLENIQAPDGVRVGDIVGKD